MAWLAIGAVVGLALCALWALSSRVRGRAAADRAPRTRRPHRRASRGVLLAVLVAIGMLFVGGVVFLVAIDRQGATDGGGSPDAAVGTVPYVDPGQALRRPPADVRIEVVNAAVFPKLAADVADALRTMGYTITGTMSGRIRAGSAVQCKDGFAHDAVWITSVLGGTTANEPFPEPAPPEAANVDCFVVVGREL